MLEARPIWDQIVEADRLIRKLDPAVKAIAFDRLLCDMQSGSQGHRNLKNPIAQDIAVESKADFFSKHNHKKPAENVYLVFAWLFSQDSSAVVTRGSLTRTAVDVGIIIPDRPDKTMDTAKIEGKAIFQKTDSGYRPTVHGQLFFKKKYGVQGGSRHKPSKEQIDAVASADSQD